MENLSFNFQIDEFMLFCRTRKLRVKTMNSYEQALRLFERWCWEQFEIDISLIRRRASCADGYNTKTDT